MKNILVPTDFSENADKALDFAMMIAHKTGAKVHLIHAYSSTGHAGHFANVNRVIKEDREKEMKEYLAATKDSIVFELEIDGRCRRGHEQNIIEGEAHKVSADLIVMGTLGASHIGKKVMGSVASNLIKNTRLPVLAIPANSQYTDLSNLVVALDALSTPIPKVLNPMVALAKKLGLEINLVHVSKQKIHTEIDPNIKDYLTQTAVPFNYTKVQSDDILDGILGFAEEKGNSLLCLVSHQRSWFENLFHSSVSQKIALKANLPLLVLHDVEPS